MIKEIREPKVLKRIAELSALKYPIVEIKKEIKKDYGVDAGEYAIKGIIKQYSVRGNMFLENEKDLANALKESIIEVLGEAKKNVSALGEYREAIKEKIGLVNIERVLTGEENKKIKGLFNEIREMIKVQNNSILTVKSVLELLDKQKSDVSLSSVQSIQMTKKDLEALEKAGMIVINPKYKEKIKSEESEKEVENE